jgi:hypothetical protein
LYEGSPAEPIPTPLRITMSLMVYFGDREPSQVGSVGRYASNAASTSARVGSSTRYTPSLIAKRRS